MPGTSDRVPSVCCIVAIFKVAEVVTHSVEVVDTFRSAYLHKLADVEAFDRKTDFRFNFLVRCGEEPAFGMLEPFEVDYQELGS